MKQKQVIRVDLSFREAEACSDVSAFLINHKHAKSVYGEINIHYRRVYAFIKSFLFVRRFSQSVFQSSFRFNQSNITSGYKIYTIK